jgi:predicted phage terminase large subunit-like protein
MATKRRTTVTKPATVIERLVGQEVEREPEEWEIALLHQYVDIYPDLVQLVNTRQAPLFGPAGIRKMLAEREPEYFARAYFPEYIPGEMPGFHRDWCEDFRNVIDKGGGSSVVRAAPRGHAKTTLWDFIFPNWTIVYKKKKFILILSDSGDQADSFITNIKDALENNERIREDFGNLQGKVWQESKIVTATGIIVEALGVGMKVRGRRNKEKRPDLIIGDDLENDENTATPDQRKKLKRWYKRALRRAGAAYTDFFVVGTIIDDDSLLAELTRTPGYDIKVYRAVISFAEREDLWDEWKKIYINLENPSREKDARAFFDRNRKEMLRGTKTLWENGNPNFPDGYYSIMVARVVDGEESFWSELQNDPKASEDKFFQPVLYTDHDRPALKKLLLVMTVDPSMGKTEKADFSAIIVLATDRETGQMYTVVADIARRSPDVTIEAMFVTAEWFMNQGLRFKVVGIEDVQFQAFFASEAFKRAMKRRLHLPIKPFHRNLPKNVRVEGMQPSINNGYVKIHEQHTLLRSQLESYPKGKKDGPDALEMAIDMSANCGGSQAGELPGAVTGQTPAEDITW